MLVCIYMVDRNNAGRGNVKRQLPELSNFPPYGELFVAIYLCHYFSSLIIFSCRLNLSDQRTKYTAKINCRRRKTKQGLRARTFGLIQCWKKYSSCTKPKSIYTDAESTLQRSTRLCIAGDSILINGSTVFVSYLYTVVSEILGTSIVQEFVCGLILPRNYSDGSAYFG